MSRLRWRVGAFCAVLLAAFALSGVRTENTVTAEDKQPVDASTGEESGSATTDSAKDAEDADDSSKDSDKPSSSKKKKEKKREVAPKKKTKKQPPARSGTRNPAGRTGGPVPATGGGSSPATGSGNSGAASGSGAPTGGAAGGASGGGASGNGGSNRAAGRAGEGDRPGDPEPEGYPADVQRVLDIQNKHTDSLMKQDGVVGTATGLTKDGKIVLKVYTNGARGARIPAKVDGVDVQVVESGPFKALNGSAGSEIYDPKEFASRPVAIGTSSAPEVESCSFDQNCYSGTLGCRLKSRDGKRIYALSNNHVFANENLYGEGKKVLQPSPGDLACTCVAENQIGQLFRLKPIDFSGDNIMDAAIILTTKDLVNNRTLPDGYGAPRNRVVRFPQLGMRVQKYGRTTGYTKGRIIDINATVQVGYSTGVARFINQIQIIGDDGLEFAAPGDSGSLIVADDRRPVALLFAGSLLTGVVDGNPIQAILDEFDAEVDGSEVPIGKVGDAGGNVPPDGTGGLIGGVGGTGGFGGFGGFGGLGGGTSQSSGANGQIVRPQRKP